MCNLYLCLQCMFAWCLICHTIAPCTCFDTNTKAMADSYLISREASTVNGRLYRSSKAIGSFEKPTLAPVDMFRPSMPVDQVWSYRKAWEREVRRKAEATVDHCSTKYELYILCKGTYCWPCCPRDLGGGLTDSILSTWTVRGHSFAYLSTHLATYVSRNTTENSHSLRHGGH